MAGPYYQQPGQYPQGAAPRRMPPKKKKNDAMVWTIAIVVSLVCVVGAIILIINRPGADGGQQKSQRQPIDMVLGSIVAGMFESQIVKDSELYQYLDQATREAFEAARSLPTPKRNAKVVEASSLDGYIERIGRQRAIQANHPTLMAIEDEYTALSKKLNAKDDPEQLRQSVLEFPEFAAKLRLILAKGRVDDERTRKRHQDKIEEWGGKLRNLASTRTNREYGEAKNKILSEKGDDYKKLKLMEALNMYCNNIADYPTIDAYANDPNTKADYDLLKNFYPQWSEKILDAYNRDTAAWVKSLIDDATSKYEDAAAGWNAERSRVNTEVDAFVKGKMAALQALEGLVSRAGVTDDPAVQKRISDLRNSIEEARRMRYE